MQQQAVVLKGLLTQATTWMNCNMIMLSEGPLTKKVQNNYRSDRRQISHCLGPAGAGERRPSQITKRQEETGGRWLLSILTVAMASQVCARTSKLIKCTLKYISLLYVNYTSIKLFLKGWLGLPWWRSG